MSKFGQTVKGYIWWTYPRGSVPYDIMVTVILAFIFLTPLWVTSATNRRSAHRIKLKSSCNRKVTASSTK